MKGQTVHPAGFTLIELVVSMGIFGILASLMYGTFDLINRQVGSVSTQSSLAEKGQRILAFMEEDIRMIGFLLGPDAQIPYCAGKSDGTDGILPSLSPVITHTSGSPFDSLTFITAIPVSIKETTSCTPVIAADGYFLLSSNESSAGSQTMQVNASSSCYDDIVISANGNGRSLVTFDSLLLSAAAVAGSAPQVFYPLESIDVAGVKTLKFTQVLEQNVPERSIVHGVRMYRYVVNTAGGGRTLERVGWDKGCATGADVTVNLVETTNSAMTSGGVDGLKFEFLAINTISGALETLSSPPANLGELKAIRIWLLLRADKPDTGHTDTATYTLGTTGDKITLGPYNDRYRRVLLNKTVEVKNLARIN